MEVGSALQPGEKCSQDKCAKFYIMGQDWHERESHGMRSRGAKSPEVR